MNSFEVESKVWESENHFIREMYRFTGRSLWDEVWRIREKYGNKLTSINSEVATKLFEYDYIRN